MAQILVTGGAGFIGSHLVVRLIHAKHRVTVLDNLSCGDKKWIHPKALFVKGSIQDKKTDDFFKKNSFEIVYHLAAQKNLQFSKKNPVDDALTNYVGSIRLIANAKLHNVKKFIFFSSAAVYDAKAKPPNQESDAAKPSSPYGVGKLSVEYFLMQSGLRYSILRPSNVYGPRQDADGEGGVVAIFCKAIAKGRSPLIYNTGRQTRDFVYVDDVVNAALLVMNKGNGGIFNISTMRETPINALFLKLANLTKKRLYPNRGRVVDEQLRSALSNSRAKKVLGWSPKSSLSLGLKQTFEWFKRNI